jgi:hypothetical protein
MPFAGSSKLIPQCLRRTGYLDMAMQPQILLVHISRQFPKIIFVLVDIAST